MSCFSEDRRQNVIAAFNRLTSRQKSDLILIAPELFFAVARYVRTEEASS